MFLCAMLVAVVLLSLLYSSAVTGEETSGLEGQCPYPLRKPIPEGVVELLGVPTPGGVVKLNDGSVMLAYGQEYRISNDEGLTWSKPKPLGLETDCHGLIRLASGALAAWGSKPAHWSKAS